MEKGLREPILAYVIRKKEKKERREWAIVQKKKIYT